MSREVDQSLVSWEQGNLFFTTILWAGTFLPGITGRRENAAGGKDHSQPRFAVLNTNSL